MPHKSETIGELRRLIDEAMCHPQADEARYEASVILLYRVIAWEEAEGSGRPAGEAVAKALADLRDVIGRRRLPDGLERAVGALAAA